MEVQVMVTWASGVVPSDVSLISPVMSLVDMRLGSVSEQTLGSDVSEPLAVGTSDPLGFFWRQALPL